jgi:acyl-CoA-binding protein
MKLYLLQHVHEMSNEVEDTKLIGVYSSMQQAITAQDHLKSKPGFLDNQDGFFIDEYELDKTFWADGFYTE